MGYTQRVIDELKARYADQPEFIQAADEVLTSIAPAVDADPAYEEAAWSSRSASSCSASPGSMTPARCR